MSSTLNSVIGNIQTTLQVSTSRAVRNTVSNILQGRSIDPNVINTITNNVIGSAMGGIVGNAAMAVNSTVFKALSKKFKNPALSLIASNYASGVLAQIITGRQTGTITTHMTNAITKGISAELMSRLPSSLTKNMKIDVLGTQFTTGLSPVVSKAVNDTVRAMIGDMFSNTGSMATQVRIPGMAKSTPPADDSSFNFSSITDSLMGGLSAGSSSATGSIVNTLYNVAGSLGSSISVIVDSLTSGSALSMSSMQLPAGLDMTRFTTGGDGIGKLIELSSTPMGSKRGVAGMSKSQFTDMQTQLVNSNINNPQAVLGGKFAGYDACVTGTTTTSGTRGISKDLTSKLVDINTEFGVMSPQDAKTHEEIANTTIELNKFVAFDASKKAAAFNTTSNDQLEKLTTIKEGFRDPNAVYPLPEYVSRTETNKLATGDVEGTIVEKKNQERMRGAQLPNGGSWDQPQSAYAAEYPYNHVRETESGHVIELDDTPGAERLHVYHKSGTSTEIDSVGNRVNVIKGSDYTIVDKNGYISIQGKANVSISGSCNIFVGADANIDVTGNVLLNGHNDVEINAAGRLKLTAGEGVDIKSPEVYIDADNTFQLNADVNAKLHVKEFNLIVDTDMKIDVNNSYKMHVNTNYDVKVLGVTKFTSVGNFNLNTDATMYQTAKTELNIKSSGAIKSTASTDVHVKAGGAIFETSTGAFNIKSGSDLKMTATSNINNSAGGMILEQGDGWVMSTGSGVMSSNGGNMSLNTSGTIAMDGSAVHLNSGVSSSTGDTPAAATSASSAAAATAAGAAEALETEYCDANYLSERKIKSETPIADVFSPPHTTNKVVGSVLSQVMGGHDELDEKTQAILIEDHGIDPAAIHQTPIIVEQAPVVSNTVTQTIPDELPLGDTVVPANWKLSPYFTVGSLTTQAKMSNALQPVGDSMVLSKVVANLQYIALNVLEPVYAARPDMQIHLGFCPITTDQTEYARYNYGLAVMLDFKDATSFDDYYDIAHVVRQIIPFDEMTIMYMSPEFSGSSQQSALLATKVPGAYYPNATTVSTIETIQEWIAANNKKELKTWYNGKFVSKTNLVKIA